MKRLRELAEAALLSVGIFLVAVCAAIFFCVCKLFGIELDDDF